MINNDLYKKLQKKKGYSESTIRNIKSSLRWCYKNLLNCNPPEFFNIDDFKDNIDLVLENLDKYQNRNVVKTNLNFLINVCEIFSKKSNVNEINKLKDYFKYKAVYSSNVQRLENSKNKEIIEIDFSPLIKLYKENIEEENTYENWNKFILVLFMSHMPLRLNEFNNLMWEDNGENNYINFLDCSLIIRNHKTVSKKGIKKIKYPESIFKSLNEWKNINNSKYVFPKKNNDKMSRDDFYRMIKDIFPKGYGIHNIRSSHTSKTFQEMGIDKDQINKIINLVNGMGHNLSTSNLDYYKKFKK